MGGMANLQSSSQPTQGGFFGSSGQNTNVGGGKGTQSGPTYTPANSYGNNPIQQTNPLANFSYSWFPSLLRSIMPNGYASGGSVPSSEKDKEYQDILDLARKIMEGK